MARGDQITPARPMDPPVLAAGRRFGGRYRLARQLGHGGMAGVWLATDERLDRLVAVKVISDTIAGDREYVERFRREATLAAGLQHPNLVAVYDFDAGERPYLVMEYIEGGNLADLLAAGQAPPAEQLARELLAALRHIHAAGVLHRDIKPHNVLVDADRHARLTDFGIAQPRDAPALTRTGQVIGTETYMAPEVMAGDPASERSDLFALGVLLADAAREGADQGLWSLIDRLRDRVATRRPPSAAAALAVLERGARRGAPGPRTEPMAVVSEPPEPPAPPGPLSPPPFEPTISRRSEGGHPGGRRTGLLAAAAIVVLAAAAVAVVLTSGGDDGSPGLGTERAAVGGPDEANRSDDSDQGSGSDTGGASDEAAAGSTANVADGGSSADASAPGDGWALNDEGFQLIEAGRPDDAVPVLEDAVAALEGSGDEATYNYALYNLGNALLLSGRPEEAIPYLEQRLGFDDGQLATVRDALDRARAAAGGSGSDPDSDAGGGGGDSGAIEPEDEAKPGKGPKHGDLPPPFEDEGGVGPELGD
jgi:tetratricopeptide (TPR) repeat protein